MKRKKKGSENSSQLDVRCRKHLLTCPMMWLMVKAEKRKIRVVTLNPTRLGRMMKMERIIIEYLRPKNS